MATYCLTTERYEEADMRELPEGDELHRRHRLQLEQALAALRSGDADAVGQAVEELAKLAAVGFEPALGPLLGQVLQDRLAEQAIRSVLLDPADIEDAVQSTLIVVAEKISTFEGRSLFSTWLYRIARNEALAVIRRRGRKSEPVSNELPEASLSSKRLSSLVADQEMVHAALQKLSPDHREVLYLREDLQMSYEEIAAKLEVPINTVRTRISRARRTLFNMLLGRNG